MWIWQNRWGGGQPILRVYIYDFILLATIF